MWYNDAGQALHFDIFDDANFLVLVEPQIILNAPEEYLLAGIGDTLAKWYEAVVLAPQPETLPLTVRPGLTARWLFATCCWNTASRRWLIKSRGN